ncbi:MAG TPA: tetratricopeptide repeat protein [Bacteroidota bacterium]|nr:tetratricopeptide repeat protein [Bacteroidota bacterium]
MRRTLALLFVLAAMPAALPAQVPWYVSYERALNAQEEGDWKASVPLLQDAVAQKQAPRLKAKTYGLRFVNYFPYFHLGEAYYHLGEKQKAVENFDVCLKYGEIREAPEEFALLTSHRNELTGNVAERGAPPAHGGPGEARPAVQLEPPDAMPPVATSGLPWYVSYETGLAYMESGDWLNAIENFRDALGANAIPRRYARTYGMWFITYIPYYELGEAYFNQGMWALALRYLETSERLGEVNEMEAESRNLKSLLDEARMKAAGAKKAPASEELKGYVNDQIAQAVRLFNENEDAKAESALRSVLRIDPYNSVARSYLARIAQRTGTADQSAQPPPEFSRGVLELVRGHHEQAIRLLKAAEPSMAGDASLHAYLGVAYCLRHRAAGSKDKDALRSARLEFQRALAIEPSYRLDRTLFSRDVTDIFEKELPK